MKKTKAREKASNFPKVTRKQMVEPRLKSELFGFRTQALSFYIMGLGETWKRNFQVFCCPDYYLFSIQVDSSTSWYSLMLLAGVGTTRLFFSLASNFLLQQCKRNEQDTTRKLLFPMWHQILSPYTYSLPLHFISLHTLLPAPQYTLQPHHILPPQDLLFIHPFIYYCHIIRCIKCVYVASLGLVQERQPTSHIRSY